jgi:hypothetical protein
VPVSSTILLNSKKGIAVMGKLHEVLAVEGEVKTTATAILAETLATLAKKHDHFEGQTRKYAPSVDGGETFPDENKEMVTTVKDKLEYATKHLVRDLDVKYQKEAANTHAKADLEINGKVLVKDVPATFLLTLEQKLKEIKQAYLAIPTLEPGEHWIKDTQNKNTYVADVKYSHRTNKVLKPVVLYPHTDKHPAQIDKIMVDERVGTWATTKYSGKLAPIEKADFLERIDQLIGAVKKARCRANEVEAPSLQVGQKLFDFIHSGSVE